MLPTTPPSLVETVSRRIVNLAYDHQQERLPTERTLSARFGVSRSVIREAAKRLENQGLLEIRQGSGMKVVANFHKPINSAIHLMLPMERDRIIQLTEVRFALEPENARLAAERATEAELAALTACHERFLATSTLEEQVEADRAFHCMLAEVSGNKIALLLIQSLSDLFQASLKHGYSRVTKEQAVTDHSQILRAILARKAAAAYKAMQKHLIHAQNDLGLNQSNHTRS
jgi:DNA-binding FadR family transcriptional regulator